MTTQKKISNIKKDVAKAKEENKKGFVDKLVSLATGSSTKQEDGQVNQGQSEGAGDGANSTPEQIQKQGGLKALRAKLHARRNAALKAQQPKSLNTAKLAKGE